MADAVTRAFAVHGHFYQPPRENPWTEAVPREPSAAPYHDWNERITAECYRPNAVARVVDQWNRVVDIVDNYRHLSFDMGPTLLWWLERRHPDVYSHITGHGRAWGERSEGPHAPEEPGVGAPGESAEGASQGAVAQAYSHTILPLADERHVRTQLRWGLADFAHRFGRAAEGMWLPECAVNDDVLRVLAEEGVCFTIVMASQVEQEDGAPVDPRRVYRWNHPAGDGRGVDLVVADMELSHAVAFELPGLSSEAFVERAIQAAPEGGLVVLATDGESFGHHHHWGERFLAYALAVEAPRRELRVVPRLADVLDEMRDGTARVRQSSWSCVHGIERWRDDCGCSTGGEPGWNQAWRRPLREALDRLAATVREVFDRRAPLVLRDPVAALDAYIGVVIGAVARDDFAAAHVTGDAVEAFTLLEAERHAMAMFTSCGWFFNDLAGIETVQVLRYAARTADLVIELGDDPHLDEVLDVLAKAESNVAGEGNGRDVWARHVDPARVGPARVVAHLALLDLLEDRMDPEAVPAYDVDVGDHHHDSRGALALCSGRVTLVHRRTGRRSEHVYAALHLGGLEVLGATRPADPARDDADLAALRDAMEDGAPATFLLRLLGERLGPAEFDLTGALPDGADQILEGAAGALADRFAGAYDRLFADHAGTLRALAAAGYPLPPVLRAPAELALARRLEAEVAALDGSDDPADYVRAVAVANEARAQGVRIDTPAARAAIQRVVESAVADAAAGADGAVDRAIGLLGVGRELDLSLDLDRAQELLHPALAGGRDASPELRRLAGVLRFAPPS